MTCPDFLSCQVAGFSRLFPSTSWKRHPSDPTSREREKLLQSTTPAGAGAGAGASASLRPQLLGTLRRVLCAASFLLCSGRYASQQAHGDGSLKIERQLHFTLGCIGSVSRGRYTRGCTASSRVPWAAHHAGVSSSSLTVNVVPFVHPHNETVFKCTTCAL